VGRVRVYCPFCSAELRNEYGDVWVCPRCGRAFVVRVYRVGTRLLLEMNQLKPVKGAA